MVDSFKQYLNEIGRYPLLTAEQEIQLSRQVDAAKPLSGKAELTAEEKRVLKIGERATRKLINCNLRLVVTVAKQYVRRLNGSGMELTDLVQEGALGLTRAVELFDGTKGYKFSTYAYWWIRQAITRGIDSKERLIRVPQHGLDKVYKVVRYQKQYLQMHGKMPTLAELAEATDLELEHLQLLLARNAWHRSLDELVVETGSPILDMIPDAEATDRQIDCMEKDEKAAMLSIALNCLSSEELHTISRRYGLGGAEPMTLSSIASEDGVSRERVRQRVQLAHNKMRLQLKATRLV
jgi:RNA polymerase sigma factor (sigma-70 family)